MKVFSRKNALLLAALLIALAAACAFALSRAQTAVMLKETAFAPDGERDAMTVSLEATEDLRTIKGEMHLTATNRTGGDLSEIVLRAYANAIQPGSVTLSDATVNGERASISADSDDSSVWRIETPWRAGETAEVCWRVSLIVPRGEGEIGRTDESALLIGALPTPAMWENGAWRTDGYDELAGTSYGQAMDVRMTLTVPNGVQAAFGGAWVGERDNGDGTRTLTMQLSGAREISFALRTKGAMRQTTVDGVLVTALAQNARTASRLLDIAADALEDIGQLGPPDRVLRAALDGALYAALNAAMMAGALPTLLALSARKRRACVALLVLLFGLLLTLGMLVCQRHLQSVAMQPLPFVWLSRRLGSGGYLLVALCLYAAALSTLCAMLCAMANLLPRGLKTIARLILSALLCAALARVGFGRIVQSGYPILGALCAALLLLLALPARQDASMSAR